jgi:hypothetical protein
MTETGCQAGLANRGQTVTDPTIFSAELTDGTITAHVDSSLMPPDDLFGFAQRINPKRSFLFVSKVLGRHVPVRPSVMRQTFDLLASQIPADLPGPILFIGMAETAIGLGAGVHRQFRQLTGRKDALYICTTRHDLGLPLVCGFQEEHSHATGHLVHEPINQELRNLLYDAHSLVLVDDEASTGKTFGNLFSALPASIRNNIRKTVLVTLTDWSDGAARSRISGDVSTVSLLNGRFSWKPNGLPATAAVIPVAQPSAVPPISPDVSLDWARLGIKDHQLMIDASAAEHGATLVLGTGEHVWQPFLLAEKLEQAGADVFYSSVTRSPISIGHMIRSRVSFVDNYGGHVPNYLYNIDPPAYEKIVLCSETDATCVSQTLIEALGHPVIVTSANQTQN